jgi:uncharacterized protein
VIESLFGHSASIVAVLVIVGAVAGFIDSIAGGGGLLTVPAMLLAGLPQVDTLATNKLQSSFGSFSATLAFTRAGRIDFRRAWPWVAWTFAGAVLGTMTVSSLPVGIVKPALPVLIAGVGLFFLFGPKLTDESRQARLSAGGFGVVAGASIGFYDGVFGPGTGSFFMLAFVLLLGYGVLQATAHTKLLNFTSNIASLAAFLIGGHVHVALGLAMGAGQFAGAQLGARLAIRKGVTVIRPMLVLVSFAMAAKLGYDMLAG